ncbi:MAG: hypothetical protein KDB71_14355 [Mycobacterium sp.]|nr:hypothetical protein [Mycobacterium sp.]
MAKRFSVVTALLAALAGAAVANADADPPAPQLGAACSPELADTMTLLPDEQTYAVCSESGAVDVWSAVQTPFEPSDSWLSYGPSMTLHGQGMRNPNLTSGSWTATPQDPQTVCRAVQKPVVAAGVLGIPEVSESQPGEPLTLRLPPNLFSIEISGNCLWTRV